MPERVQTVTQQVSSIKTENISEISRERQLKTCNSRISGSNITAYWSHCLISSVNVQSLLETISVCHLWCNLVRWLIWTGQIPRKASKLKSLWDMIVLLNQSISDTYLNEDGYMFKLGEGKAISGPKSGNLAAYQRWPTQERKRLNTFIFEQKQRKDETYLQNKEMP